MNYLQELFWYKNWSSLTLVSALLLLSLLFNWQAPLEARWYAYLMQHWPTTPSERVTLVQIDDESLAELGDLPWPRHYYAEAINRLAPYVAHIGLVLPVYERQSNPALPALQQAIQLAAQAEQTAAPAPTPAPGLTTLFNNLQNQLETARTLLNGDAQLVAAVQRARYVITGAPAALLSTNQAATALPPLPEAVLAHSVRPISEHFDTYFRSPQPPLIAQLKLPFSPLLHQSRRIATIPTQRNAADRVPLISRYQNHYLPSLPLVLASEILTPTAANQLEVRLGQGIRLSEYRINTDPTLQLISRFYSPEQFDRIAFVDLLNGTIPVSRLIDQVVLIGISASAYQQLQATPLGAQTDLTVMAAVTSSLLQQDFLTQPDWAIALQIAVTGLILMYLIFLMPRLRWPWAIALSLTLFALGFAGSMLLFNQQVTIPLIGVLSLLPVGQLTFSLRRMMIAYQDAFRHHPDAVESNRLLGLAFQGQGQLDLAFEKFRLCPLDDTLMGHLYNLALDYEQQRAYQRAAVIYRYMVSHAPTYRDIEHRLERVSRLRRPAVLRNNAPLSDWLLDANNEKPMLGRYQVERQLGKGAMGIVYLGRDPKLNRLVAIKTLALAEEFEAAQLQEATTRFFREAAAAGRLKHPNIIAIYDAGEEDELAYLCMEFFKGSTLIPYTHVDNLLPVPIVLRIGQAIAEALDYAHEQGVVHRDIKPGNIMYNPATGQVKITDFGIARITDSQRTRTGVILGTPAYMSPEQLAGKALDGRTDLFSLGIMLYQLFSGHLPFQAEVMTSLMYQITNDPHPDILQYRPALPVFVVACLDQLLAKDPALRFQTGQALAATLQQCQTLAEESACN